MANSPGWLAEAESHLATGYARDVVEGRVVAGRLQRLACERHLRDLKRAARGDLPYIFDVDRADHVLDFCLQLRHFAGEWGLGEGQPFVPEPWQVFILASLFGWVDEHGHRRFRIAYVQVARKNGKTFMATATGLYLLLADGEPGAQVFCAATKFKQAKLVFDPAKRMAQKAPALRPLVRPLRDRLIVDSTASYFEPLGADSEREDGLNVHGAILDEVHEHPNSRMKDVLSTATGARRQALIVEITTAGRHRYGFGGQERDYYAKVVEPAAKVVDETAFAFICEPDEADLLDFCPLSTPCVDMETCAHRVPGWSREDVWRKANPNLEVSVRVEDLRAKAGEALQRPTAVVNFLTKHLNVWTSSRVRWIKLADWDRCARRVDLDALQGRECFGGLDLSSLIDMTAFALYFPAAAGEPAAIAPFFFMPEERIPERVAADRVPYDAWARDGYIIPTPGDQVDHDVVEEAVKKLAERFNPREIGYDKYDATQMAQHLVNDGLTMVPLAQTVATYHPACKELERLLLTREFAHGGHPVLRWNAENVEVEFRSDGGSTYMRPRKPSDENGQKQRIDGMVAALMAISRAVVAAPAVGPSRYEQEGAEFAWIEL